MPGVRHAAGHQRAGEQVALPLGEGVAGVEHEPGRSDGRQPEDRRFLHPFGPEALGYAHAVVVAAVGDHGPAVVLAGFDRVQLVAALRGVLRGPGLVGLRVEREAHLVAVAHRVDLGLVPRHADERVVVGHAAVEPQAERLAGVAVRVLGQLGVAEEALRAVDEISAESPAHRHVHDVLAGHEGEPGGRDRPAPGLGDEHVLDVDERGAVELAADQGDGALAAGDLPRVGEVDVAVVGEVRMNRDLHHPGKAAGKDVVRHAGDGLVHQHAVANQAQVAAALGDQHVALGQERERPRTVDAADDDGDLHLGDQVGVHDPRLVRQFHAGKAAAAAAVSRLRDRLAGDGGSEEEHGDPGYSSCGLSVHRDSPTGCPLGAPTSPSAF